MSSSWHTPPLIQWVAVELYGAEKHRTKGATVAQMVFMAELFRGLNESELTAAPKPPTLRWLMRHRRVVELEMVQG